jgi:uncharacterized protein YkwD
MDTSKYSNEKGPPPPDFVTIVIKSKVPFDQKKVMELAPKPVRRKVIKDKVTFEVADDRVSTLYMPSDRVIVLTSLDGALLDPLIGSDGMKPMLPVDAQALAREARKGTAWAIIPFDQNMQGALKMVTDPMLLAQVPPELQPALKVVPDTKAVGVWLGADQTNLKISVGLACGSDANAKAIAGPLQAYWAKMKPQWQQLVQVNLKEAKLPPDVETLIKNIFDSTAATPKETVAEVSVQFSVQAIDNIVKQVMDPKTAGMYASLGQSAEKLFEKPFVISPEEKALLDAINKEREADKLDPLKANPKLFAVARAHAAGMARVGAADDEIDEMDNVKRLEKAGIAYEKTEINLAVGNWQQAIAKWKGTQVEKDKYMGKFTETGIGIGVKDGKVFTTQIYLLPKGADQKKE